MTDFQKHIELNKQLNGRLKTLSSEATIKDCFHHKKEECKLPIKNAHSLQRQGSLKILEREVDGNLSVYCHTEREVNKQNDFIDLKPLGRKAASTFFGFCDFHDTSLFSVIENEPEITDIESDEHCFLHSYRSFAHSYHRKYEEYKLYTSRDSEVIKILEELHGRAGIESNKMFVEMALDDLSKPKERMDNYIENREFDALDYLCYEYKHTIPIACAACTTPAYNLHNVPVNISTDPTYVYSNIITTALPFSKRSVLILAAFPEEPNGVKYLDDIDNIKPNILQEKFLSYHLINNAENCYISPSFYNSKSQLWKKEYCYMINYIGAKHTPYMGFNKFFPINYFSVSEKI
ncbi:hypothetical protein [Aequorivita echinoideorum]|uniref:Uncharacterized protein n=1 Tax=Aequorivita echinoideorum TaxID=1549647 RepID=A0ABS5S345_9FLAO|nr:hypothetical protein [Aequorivita echinoideorum]MBT0606822.1 hypothetical protein [Aequorivita echinoideorum]